MKNCENCGANKYRTRITSSCDSCHDLSNWMPLRESLQIQINNEKIEGLMASTKALWDMVHDRNKVIQEMFEAISERQFDRYDPKRNTVICSVCQRTIDEGHMDECYIGQALKNAKPFLPDDRMTEKEYKEANPETAHTWDWDEHPEGYEGECACRLCRGYSNN